MLIFSNGFFNAVSSTHTKKNLIIFHFIGPVADRLPWLHATKGNWEKYFFHHSDDLALYYCLISAFHFLFFSSPLWSVFCCVSRLHFVCVLICLVLEFSCSSAMHVTAQCGPISPKLQNPKKCVPVKDTQNNALPKGLFMKGESTDKHPRHKNTHIQAHTHTSSAPILLLFAHMLYFWNALRYFTFRIYITQWDSATTAVLTLHVHVPGLCLDSIQASVQPLSHHVVYHSLLIRHRAVVSLAFSPPLLEIILNN